MLKLKIFLVPANGKKPIENCTVKTIFLAEKLQLSKQKKNGGNVIKIVFKL